MYYQFCLSIYLVYKTEVIHITIVHKIPEIKGEPNPMVTWVSI